MAITISLIDFADFIMKVGPSQLTKVKDLCFRDDYHPSHDFWKGLRKAIQCFHEAGGQDVAIIDRSLAQTKDQKRLNCYPNAIKGYKRFLGRKSIQWFSPIRDTWKFRELHVRINPDLGLVIDGIKYLIKLYFKDDPIDSHKLKLVFALMRSGLPSQDLMHTKMALVEVTKGKLHIEGKSSSGLDVLLEAQAISLIHLWHAVEGEKHNLRSA